jgi:uncharacterized protein YhaN
MKINAFKMLTFGPFTDRTFDFSRIENGLHVVYGENEAGKSSSLRAMIAWLYGFEHRVTDDWLHAASKLAVSGALVLNDGALLRFTRFKRRKNNLIDDDTGRPFEQHVLDQHLGGKTRTDFENAYGISHESLRRGVESVLAVHGELGQTLFTATSGLNVLKDVLSRLEERQAKLFAPRAQKASINAGISLLSSQRKKIREASTSHVQWKQLRKELALLEDQKQQIEERLSDLNRTIGTLSRYRSALNYVTRFQQVDEEIGSLASVPELSEDFAQKRIQVQAAVKQYQQSQETLHGELETIAKQMGALSFNETILSNQDLIETLANRMAVYTKESSDSKALRAKIHQAQRDIAAALKLLNLDLSVETLAAVRLSRPVRNKLQKLASQHTRMEQSAESAEKDLRAVNVKLNRMTTQLSQAGRPADTAELQSCLVRAAEHGNLEMRLSEAQAETALIAARVNNGLASLGLWHGELGALEKLAIPPDESMRKFADRLDALERNLDSLEKELQQTRKDIGDKQHALEELTHSRDLPDSEELQTRRALRNQGWRSVRSVWLQGGQADQEFLKHFPEHTHLADAYETSVRQADDTADILRSEAQDIAIAQALKDQISQLEKGGQDKEQQRETLNLHRQETNRRWQALWQPLGIRALSPVEMIEWSGRVRQIKQVAIDYYERVSRQTQLENALKKIDSEVTAVLDRLSISVPENISHAGLMDQVKRLIKENEELVKQRKELELRIGELEAQKLEIDAKLGEIEEQKLMWSGQWSSAILPLRLPASTEPAEVMEYIDALDDIFKRVDERQANQQRIDAMDRNRKDFEEAVRDTIARLAPQLRGMETEKAVTALKGLLSENIQRRQRHQSLQADQRKMASQLSATKEELAGNQEVLRQLSTEAGTSDPERLAEVERQSRRKSMILKDAAALKDRLSELASGMPLPQFVEKVRSQDPDRLAADLEKAETDKSDLTKERENLVARIAVAKSELDQFDGRSRAARLAVETDGLRGKIQSDVEHYVTLRLASAILAKAIERYRKHNQSPVLEAASHYFQTLTRGSFSRLKADFNDKGEPVLKAVRGVDGTALSIDALSDGTRDQMFLALRLGGLSRHIEISGRVPFIVDDVLVHFDDARSSAALLALAALAEKTQIIFFTHHRHLIDLAENTVPQESLCLHYL